MATARTRRRAPAATTLRSGPWTSVRSTVDPVDDEEDQLVDATNIYIPDPTNKSGAYALPGIDLANGGVAVALAGIGLDLTTEGGVTLTTEDAVGALTLTTETLSPNFPLRGQGVFWHTSLSGVTTNFEVTAGRLLRASSTYDTLTDVTPPFPIQIDPNATTRVYGTSFADQLVITDGVNPPWLATNLTSTPITGTYIDFDGQGTPWTAFGPFVVYAGSFFCILNTFDQVAARTDLAWSIPADASQGYQQTNYDFRWTVEQTDTRPLYALAPTNTQLYYFRELSIGSISGTPGPNLQGQATHDQISANVGTTAPQSVRQFLNNIFFTDKIGRPYQLTEGSRDVNPIWLAMRAIVDQNATGFPNVNSVVCTSALIPDLNLYVVCPWSSSTGQYGPSVEGYTFDARTGHYMGRFQVAGGCQIETLGNWIDLNGSLQLVVLGSAVPPTGSALAVSGFVGVMNNLTGVGDFLVTEGGVQLVTEGTGVLLTLEGNAENWTDYGAPKVVSVTSGRMGYDLMTVLNVDRGMALVGSSDPVAVSVLSSATAQTVEGTPTPSMTFDGVSKVTCGFSGVQGRGIQMSAGPTVTSQQWIVQQLVVQAVVMVAAPDEP